jgi:apolipoprotein N-acyltransferase
MKQKISLALLSGLLLGLSYPNYPDYPLGLLGWVAFVPLMLALRSITHHKKYFLVVWLAFSVTVPIGFWWTSYHSWQAFILCYFSQTISFYGAFVIHYFIQKRYGWQRALILLPFVWTLFEWATHLLPHNLQVLHLAYTQAHLPYIIQFADLTGMWGVTFWLMTLNVLLAFGIHFKLSKYALLSGAWIFLAVGYSVWVIHINPKSVLGTGNSKTKVSLIQTNIDSYATNDSLIVAKTLQQVIALADSAVATHHPDLLVLPEAVFPFSLFQNKNFLDFTRSNIVNWNTNLAIGYINSDAQDSSSYKNLALVFTPQLAYYWDSLRVQEADVKVYQKEYGLPFAEFMPYCQDCASLRNRKLQRGSQPYTFLYANGAKEQFNMALSICWEQTYPHKIASLVRDGATYVAMMNNDAWFGQTPGAKFLTSFTILRAIENRRTIARCSNGGISAFTDPFGRIYGEVPWFMPTISTQEVLCVYKKTIFTRYPNAFAYGIAVMVLLMLAKFEFFDKKRHSV